MKKTPKYSPDPALSMPAFIQYIGRMDRSQLQQLNEAIKERWNILDDDKRAELKVGDIVWFNARRRGTIYGRITHFNRKRLGLVDTNGLKWKVSPGLLNIVTDKKRADDIRTRILSKPVEDFSSLLGALGGRRRR